MVGSEFWAIVFGVLWIASRYEIRQVKKCSSDRIESLKKEVSKRKALYNELINKFQGDGK